MPDRLLRESIRVSESINQLTAFEETFFYRLMVSVDDSGKIMYNARMIAATLYPLKSVRESQVNDTLHKLRSAGLITDFKDETGRLYVRLVNWDRYQSKANPAREDRKDKPKKKAPPKPAGTPSQLEERFERFWKAYPKKTGKGKARESFAKYNPDDELTEKMISAVEAAKRTRQWQRDNGQYIPMPATWLNQQRWEDEPEEDEPDRAYMLNPGLEDWD